MWVIKSCINYVLLPTDVAKIAALSFGALVGFALSLWKIVRCCQSPMPKIVFPEGWVLCFPVSLLTSVDLHYIQTTQAQLVYVTKHCCHLPAVQNPVKVDNVHEQISRTTGTMGERFKAHQNVSGYKPVLPSLELLENGKLTTERVIGFIYIITVIQKALAPLSYQACFLKKINMRQYQFELNIVVIFIKSLKFYRWTDIVQRLSSYLVLSGRFLQTKVV